MTSPRKKVAVILNGISRKKSIIKKRFLPALEREFSVDVFETQRQDHAIEIGKSTTVNGYEVVVVAGGDGTLNQVVNGVLSSGQKSLPQLALVPIGSGNDFARTIGVSVDAEKLVELIKTSEAKYVDVGQVEFIHENGQSTSRYFVNVLDLGMGPYVVQKVPRLRKFLPGGVAYYSAIIATFFSYQLKNISLKSDRFNWAGKVRSLAIANGNFFGHGLCIAPDAKVSDGLLNLFICGNVSVLDFIKYSETLKKGKHIILPEIKYSECTTVEISSAENCLIEADGEILGRLPATAQLATRKIAFLC